MTPTQIKKSFEEYLDQVWGFPGITTVRKLSEDPPDAFPYIEAHLVLGGVFSLEIQGAAERVGVLKISIFTEPDVEDDEGLAYGNTLEKLFWNKNLDGIICENGALKPNTYKIGFNEARQALHFQTTIPFSVIWEN